MTGAMLPVVFCLLPDKKTSSYKKALREVALLTGDLFTGNVREIN